MNYRILFVACAALAAATVAQAQQSPAPAEQPPAVEPAADEPIQTSNENVVVTGARPVPVRRPERIMTPEQRQRHQAESRCIIAAQDAPDPNEVDLSVPEDACRDRPN